MIVKNYEGKCIKAMELVKLYENCIQLKQKNALTLLFLEMSD